MRLFYKGQDLGEVENASAIVDGAEVRNAVDDIRAAVNQLWSSAPRRDPSKMWCERCRRSMDVVLREGDRGCLSCAGFLAMAGKAGREYLRSGNPSDRSDASAMDNVAEVPRRPRNRFERRMMAARARRSG